MARTIQDVINKFVLPVTESGCWLWMGCDDGNGYGAVTYRRKRWLAHRLLFIHFKGEVPKGLELDHLCRVRCCVNPHHLEPVTRAVNVARGLKKRQTHCKRGHELTGDNIYIKPGSGDRGCHQCMLDYLRRRDNWKGGLPFGKREQCSHGHPFAGENLGFINGHRFCRTCAREHNRLYHQRKKQQIATAKPDLNQGAA